MSTNMNIFNTIINGIKGNKVTINGKTYSGNNIQISNNKVFIDGKEVDCADRELNISITGDVDTVKTTSGDVNVTGSVKSVSTTSGDIEIGGNVSGNVSSISGDVSASGGIQGNVSTVSGDVRQ